MDLEHPRTDSAAAEVLDRILDKGILVEGPRATPEAGLSRISAVARVRVLRAETYLQHTHPYQPRAA